MPRRHRSPGASATTEAGSSQGVRSPVQQQTQGPDNTTMQDSLAKAEQETLGFLATFEAQDQSAENGDRSQAPPAPEKVESAEHEVAIATAVEAAVAVQPVAQASQVAPIEAAPEQRQSPAAVQAPAQVHTPAAPAPDLSATATGGRGSRALTPAEIAYAQRIYGASLDYTQIRMTSDHWLSTGAPKTLGNTMHMRSEWGGKMFHEDGSLTAAGKDLLVHEMGHVWQYQNGGAAYIGDSLWSQLKGWVSGGSRDEAYDWKSAVADGLEWSKWNPEQQAEAIEAYNDHLQAAEGGWISSSQQAEMDQLEPYIAMVRNGQGAPQFSVPGAVGGGAGGALVGAGIGAVVGGPIGALVGAGIGALIGSIFGGG